MKNSGVFFCACLLLASLTGAAQAATVTVTSSAGPFSPVNPLNDITFDSFATPNTFAGTSIKWGSVPTSTNGVTFSGTGIIANNAAGTSAGISATPAGDTTNYLSILGGASETLTLAGTATSFGLYWGSIDAYNQIQFFSVNNSGATLVASYTGDQLNALPPVGSNGDQFSTYTNAYIMFAFSGLTFNEVTFSSSQNAFESDNIYAAGPGLASLTSPVPESSTWAMLLLGFTGIGFVAYLRKSNSALMAA